MEDMPLVSPRMGCLRLRGTARAIDVGKVIHAARLWEVKCMLCNHDRTYSKA